MKWVEHYLPRFRFLALLLSLIWVVYFLNILTNNALNQAFSLVPLQLKALDGIIAMPFLHADFNHIVSNIIPLAVLGSLIIIFVPGQLLKATVIITILSGIMIWLFGRSQPHIGSSGLLFGWFGFLVSFAIFHRSWKALLGAAIAVFFYGTSIVTNIIPGSFDFGALNSLKVSWEAHLFGLLAGVVTAFLIVKSSQTSKKYPIKRSEVSKVKI